MILEAPPAVAMRNAKEGTGLGPSVYAGGGSASSSLPAVLAFFSREETRGFDSSTLPGGSQLALWNDGRPEGEAEYAGAVAWARAGEWDKPAIGSETLLNRPLEAGKGSSGALLKYGYWGGEWSRMMFSSCCSLAVCEGMFLRTPGTDCPFVASRGPWGSGLRCTGDDCVASSTAINMSSC